MKLDRRRRATVAARLAGGGCLLAALVSLVSGCGCEASRPAARFVVVGVDGAEWNVLERLWEQDRLPHLARLAEAGTAGRLGTGYVKSPVIWTTIATGVAPWRHGIRDFVVATERGDIPVSSTVRQVPALWNMLSSMGRRVAVLGWWASWPAEDVDGVVVSDRALQEVADRVSPRTFAEGFDLRVEQAMADDSLAFGREGIEGQDRVMTYLARELAVEGFDLMLVYLRSPDVVSHSHWKYIEPQRFDVTEDELVEHGDRIPAIYEAVDQAVGQIVAAAGPEVNVVVLSDHGFRALEKEQLAIWLDLDVVLEALGYLELRPGGAGVDLAQSRVYTYASRANRKRKLVRFSRAGREPAGKVLSTGEAEIRRRLEEELSEVTYRGGEPAFRIDDATRGEAGDGADFVVEVLDRGASRQLRIGEKRLSDAVSQISILSGTHTKTTDGVFLAAGPDIEPGAPIEGLRIHDIAPTLLYGLGLPIAEDFVGKAWTRLYTETFRNATPLRTLPTWGTREAEGPRASEVDDEILEQLRALGYL